MGKQIILGANLHIDGVSKLQILDNVSIPIPQSKTETWRGAGGMVDQEIQLGYEVLVAKFSIIGLDKDIQKYLTLAPSPNTAFTIRGYAMDDEENEIGIVATMRGLLKATEMDEISGDNLVKSSFEIACKYYKYEQDGEKIHEIDVNGAVMFIGGKDMRPKMKTLLGL
ncbi:MAG: phage major tail tube protein [Rhizobiales bacterium]|nr:phage major tail tube protein [Hyphomicrobiales bacterium]